MREERTTQDHPNMWQRLALNEIHSATGLVKPINDSYIVSLHADLEYRRSSLTWKERRNEKATFGLWLSIRLSMHIINIGSHVGDCIQDSSAVKFLRWRWKGARAELIPQLSLFNGGVVGVRAQNSLGHDKSTSCRSWCGLASPGELVN